MITNKENMVQIDIYEYLVSHLDCKDSLESHGTIAPVTWSIVRVMTVAAFLACMAVWNLWIVFGFTACLIAYCPI